MSMTNIFKLQHESAQNQKYVIAAIENKEGKILIVKRGSTAPWEPNKWSLVGGVVKQNEGLDDALIREVKEETKLSIYDLNYLTLMKGDTGITYVYTAKTTQEDPVLDWENVDWNWVTIDDLEKYDFAGKDTKTMIYDIFTSKEKNNDRF